MTVRNYLFSGEFTPDTPPTAAKDAHSAVFKNSVPAEPNEKMMLIMIIGTANASPHKKPVFKPSFLWTAPAVLPHTKLPIMSATTAAAPAAPEADFISDSISAAGNIVITVAAYPNSVPIR